MSLLLDRPRLTVPVNERDHIRGPATAPVTLVEYGDYECPFCAAAQAVTTQLLQLVRDDLQLVFRHFPLTQIHPNAALAAEAAEAAGAQGKFWEMHDMLFETQQRLALKDLLARAQALALDMDRFKLELDYHVHEPRVREDFLSGVRSGVNGTPTFFINGLRHNGGSDLGSLLSEIRAVAMRRNAAGLRAVSAAVSGPHALRRRGPA